MNGTLRSTNTFLLAALFSASWVGPELNASAFSIAPEKVRIGDCYTLQVDNGAGITLDLRYRHNQGPVQTVQGWPTLDDAGTSRVCTSAETPVGHYEFTGYKDTLSRDWISISESLEVVPAREDIDLTAVIPIPAEGLILKSANYFDLEGKTLTFTPNTAGGYAVEASGPSWEEPGPAAVAHDLSGDHTDYVRVELPFSFPFADRTWPRVYANMNGHLSFQRPERENWPQRDPWSSATMRSVAAAIDSRAAAGLEAMVAPLWAEYGDATISVDSTPDRVVISWSATRRTPGYAFHAPLGPNVFQARLYPSGRIELAYRTVAERDGIVGLFHGQNGRGRTLDAFDDAVGDVWVDDAGGDVAEPMLDITRVEIMDNGSTLLARMTLAEDVPERVADGEITYRFLLRFGDYDCGVGVDVTATGRRPWGGCGPAPRAFGYRVQGTTLEIPISKTLFHGADRLVWNADAVWWGRAHDQVFEDRTAPVDGADHDLGATGGEVNGNVFEVFHYPVVPKIMRQVTSFIYERVPTNDELAVLFTDFRIDDLFGHGGSSGPINEPVEGLGEGRRGDPRRGHSYGSESLLVTQAILFLGGENFWTEHGVSRGRAFRNFSKGIWWIAHETTHRWLASLRFLNPRTGQVEPLSDDGHHWSEWLHAPTVYPVWPSFSERIVEISIQGGAVWSDNGDGTFTRQNDNWPPLAQGLSALDLYAMGMIPPDEVPDTFILRDVEETDARDTVRATKVPVRIEDVIAAMGPRIPAADASRKEFRLGVYLLHDGPTPRPDMVRKARGVSAAVVEYFSRATGGRMRVVPNPGSAR